METKKCSRCEEIKGLCEFPIVHGRKRADGSRKSRHHSQCRKCRYNVCKSWHDKNPGYSTVKKKEWDSKNKEYKIQYDKDRRKKHPEKFKKWKSDWDKRNHDWIKQYKREQYPLIKDKIKKWHAKTRKKMIDELKDCYVIYAFGKGKIPASLIRKFPEVIELKRLELATKRELRNQLKK